MGLPLPIVIAILAIVPSTYSTICGSGGTICYPEDYQTAYCCGYNDECCYTTNVAAIWWFWLILVLGITLFVGCCATACCYRRRSRLGYVVVQGQNQVPATTVVQTNHSHVTQVPQPYPQSYQQYGPKATTGPPPPYGYPPPTAPQQPHQAYQQQQY